MFSEKFQKIFANKSKNQCDNKSNRIRSNSQNRYIHFSKEDIRDGIRSLKPSIGIDNIHSNHLKFCDELFQELLSLLFRCFVAHQYAPPSLIGGMISPTVKDKLGDLNNANNYRPIMSSSVILKLFEYCLLKKITPFIELSDSQHAFRPGHSTATACAVLKETISNYNKSKSDVYVCFIDISKAFDSVNHSILMRKLLDSGVPAIIVDFIKFWYSNQYVRVRYSSYVSECWKIQNGVRQGGVLSGLFFGLYIDSLLNKIKTSKYGCKLGILKSNILAYADDIVLIAPSASSLQILINETIEEASNLELTINRLKSKSMVISSSKITIK